MLKIFPIFLSFFAFSVIIFTNCQGQTQGPVDPPLPLEKFKKIAFEPPAPDILATLKISFLDGELYGIADADGKILLAPQFEDAEMTEWDLPFFKAKKNGARSFYRLHGDRWRVFPTRLFSLERAFFG